MALPNDRNQFQKRGGQGKPKPQSKGPEPVKVEEVPENYVEQAENVMYDLRNRRSITTTKIRNLFSLVVDICSEEELRTESTLQDKSVARLKRMHVRVIYESGRDSGTKEFVEKTKLLEYRKWIGNDRKRLIRFTRYMEALVAFHRYFGGKET